ncbi:hypothetical protein C2845_PM01G39090 [Panicum miliaceum]|uniref:Uncharacterized protein n=1 Tax=Panicum miliaceum TaxID=4540 RepID=A0A3L6TRP8_PANMI|nr:hypothetical protein C2845_PM01G39090 [Panicum miliaceum]
MLRIRGTVKAAQFVLFSSFYELSSPYVPDWSVHPLYENTSRTADHGQRKVTWSDPHAACRFGSVRHPPSAAELAIGLAASDVKFLRA